MTPVSLTNTTQLLYIIFVTSEAIDIQYVNTEEQVADIFTKPVREDAFFYLRRKVCGWWSPSIAREFENIRKVGLNHSWLKYSIESGMTQCMYILQSISIPAGHNIDPSN